MKHIDLPKPNSDVVLLDSTGTPITPHSAPGLPFVPQEAGRGRRIERKDGVTQALNQVSLFDRELVMKTGYILSRAYPDYGWLVRVVGSSVGEWATEKKQRGVMICLAELVRLSGTSTGMYLNPGDFGTEHEFQEKVKQLGGELLERARLHRGRRLNENPVEGLPDGFAGVMPERKRQLLQVETPEEFIDLVKEHKADQDKQASMAGISSQDVPDQGT